MENISLITRMIIAALLGMAIGIEREYRAKEAGIRTHFLVSVGSALFMIISEYGLLESELHFDPARIAAQIVTGIGFIGAGTIMIQKQSVKGLTTAAGLWAAAGIGMACGCGMYLIAITATLLVLIGFEFLNTIVHKVGNSTKTIVFETKDKEIFKKIIEKGFFTNKQLLSYNMENVDDKYIYMFCITVKNKIQEDKLKEFMLQFPDLIIRKIE